MGSQSSPESVEITAPRKNHRVACDFVDSRMQSQERLQELHLLATMAGINRYLNHPLFRLNHFYQSASAECKDRGSATHTFGNRVWQIIYWSWMKQKIGGMVGDTQSDVVRNESKVYNIRETKAVVCILTNEQELYILYLR